MLSSQEIRVLITALGTSVLKEREEKEESELPKVRYHTIVIMTDADVDGSHIRTLLLTLFYRHFPHLIEQGYVYIAQPPLFRVKKGKREEYLKDENALEAYLLDLGTHDSELQAAAGECMRGEALRKLVRQQLRFDRVLDVLARQRKNPEVVAALVRDPEMGSGALGDRDALQRIIERTRARLAATAPDLEPLRFALADDAEHGGLRLIVGVRQNGSAQDTQIDGPFCAGPEFAELQRLATDLRNAGEPPFRVATGEKTSTAPTLSGAVAELLAQARKGLDVQRYKGLGEMNPDQLWQTTMNPETRTLLQVRVEDAYEADEVFSTLMGDEVEPRRRFIEDNALTVKNLDI
jgi:DNA gyrase subunit B